MSIITGWKSIGKKKEATAPVATKDVFASVKYSIEAEYKDIIFRIAKAEAPAPSDVERLRVLCFEKQITLHEALRDAEVLRKARALAIGGADVEEKQEASARADAIAATESEVANEKIATIQANRDSFNNKANHARQIWMLASESRGAFNRLKELHPQLLGDVTPEQLMGGSNE